MINLLLKTFADENSPREIRRQKCGMLASITGISVNALLGLSKLFCGIITNSIALTADSINNFSDSANCAVTLLGFKISKKPADDEHPFGHGRYEYVAGFIVSLVIVVFGFELLTNSVKRIFNPVDISFSSFSIVILAVSVLFKLWLFFFYKKTSLMINSPALAASATDSITDCLTTAVSAASLIVFKQTGVNLDGYFGLPVAVLILVSGIKILKSTLDPIIGQPADRETAKKICKEITSYEKILGVHDLILHSYGEGHIFGTAHVEMPSDMTLNEVHEIVDSLERQIKNELSVNLSIHVDPIDTSSEYFDSMQKTVGTIIERIDSNLSFHDLRVVKSPLETSFIFDVILTKDSKFSEVELKKKIEDEFRRENSRFCAVVTIERNFVE